MNQGEVSLNLLNTQPFNSTPTKKSEKSNKCPRAFIHENNYGNCQLKAINWRQWCNLTLA